MLISIISDTHDNQPNLERFLRWASDNKIDGIIHCGDVTTGETLDYLAKNFPGPIKLACGNAEIDKEEFREVMKRHLNLEVFQEIGEAKFDGLNIALIHRPGKTRELAETGKYSFVFYGHTHKPWIETVEIDTNRPEPAQSALEAETGPVQGSPLHKAQKAKIVVVANPGTLGGVFTEATFAVLDTESGRLELKRVNLL